MTDTRREREDVAPRQPAPLPTHVSYWDRGLRNGMASSVFAQFVGQPSAQILGRHASEVFGNDVFELNRPFAEEALKGREQVFERSTRDSASIARHLRATYIPEVVDGAVAGFFAVVADVSADHDDTRALAASEGVFRRAFLASPVGKATFDDAGRLLELNPAICAMFGRAREDLAGRAFLELFEPADRQSQKRRLAELFAGELQTTTTEQRFITPAGAELWTILSLALAPGDQHHGSLGIVQIQDITERKSVEDRLRRSQQRLAEAEQVAQMGSWELDIPSGETTWSSGLYHIYGMNPDDCPDVTEPWQSRVYADDQPLVAQAIRRALDERSSFVLEYRARRTDGRLRTLRARGDVVVDEHGNLQRLVGVAQDVTDAKMTQDALHTTSIEMDRRARELERLATQVPTKWDTPAQRAPLTLRQLEILRNVASGMTNAAIAAELCISQSTVKWHMKQILAKTATANRAEAIAKVLGYQGFAPTAER